MSRTSKRMSAAGRSSFQAGKVLLAESRDGKLVPASVEQLITGRKDIHYPKPHVISLTQPTELGTILQC